MAALDELVYQAMSQDATLATLLAQWNGNPAVFGYHAPPDTDPGWAGKQYPRMDYTVDPHEDPERRMAGTLSINVWATPDLQSSIDAVASRLVQLLDGAVFHPDDYPVVGLRWSRSQLFSQGREQSGISMSELEPTDLLLGMLVQFDLLSFPLQTTYSPDPVAALNSWAASRFTGLQVDVSAWTPTASEPVLYWRMEGVQLAERTAAVAWMQATLYGHVIAPTPDQRLPWVRRVAEQLVLDRCIQLDDGSYFFVEKLSADTKQDPLRTGQIRVIGRYGVLVPEQTAEPINTANVSGAVNGQVT
ncbi:MAG: hypothetical protein K6T81_04320 [Alicyclobacillus macrosporangiidus]|uniref:hypothetical protein n=1 Tax=Alicyclobacillus macrosporangiidus TaxID=392015 RepID=UPI0026EC490D|nr:hypothetical protein [Alicyclobacillus macrosporangiidus]MCL6597944.1 hypothetical protein [Alicyclobacillus macrosporangiidus]